MSTFATGQLGQKQAESFLVSKGYKIIATNFATKIGEIDIIAEDGEQLVFIEVKYRTSSKFGKGFEAVGQRKLAKINLVANLYLKTHQVNKGCRIDVVSIDAGKFQLFKNVLTI